MAYNVLLVYFGVVSIKIYKVNDNLSWEFNVCSIFNYLHLLEMVLM